MGWGWDGDGMGDGMGMGWGGDGGWDGGWDGDGDKCEIIIDYPILGYWMIIQLALEVILEAWMNDRIQLMLDVLARRGGFRG